MSDSNLSLENNIKYLNTMFEISTIANQADDVYDFLSKIENYCQKIAKNSDITFYLLEKQHFKCVNIKENIRNNDFFESEVSNSSFWEAVEKAKLTPMKDGQGAHLFKSFLEAIYEYSKN